MTKARSAAEFYGAIQPRQYPKLADAIIGAGDLIVDQRKRHTYEVLNANLLLRNPLDRIVSHPRRRMNLGFAFAEFMSELAGNPYLGVMRPFIHGFEKYSSDKVFVDGSYATRIIDTAGDDQIEAVVRMLKKDPNSRRAVISLYDGSIDLYGGGGLNTPCTIALQFLFRDALHMIVTMRSNDYVLGLTYDVFNFTMLQEYVASRLGWPLGNYYHNAGSLHIYDDDIDMLSEMSSSPSPWTQMMGLMPIHSARVLRDAARVYCSMALDADERKLADSSETYSSLVKTQYCRDIIFVGYSHLLAKRQEFQHAMNVARMIEDETLAYVTMNWINR